MLPIYKSEYDPENSSEGSLDPLGLGQIADRLGVKLVPGIRERMSRPRFLTLIAAGAHLCKKFGEDRISKDGLTEPWLVYEWIIVQALVKKYQGMPEINRLPGSEKAGDARKKDIPLSAARYLKTPSVFGFHGVYRTLSEALEIVKDDLPGEKGDLLLRGWEEEQNLNGFYSEIDGPGKELKNRIQNVIDESLENNEVSKKWNWPYFDTIAQYFAPAKSGVKELNILFTILAGGDKGYRKELIELFLTYYNSNMESLDEGVFHNYCIQKTKGPINDHLKVIRLYEQFSRLMTDSFENILYELSQGSLQHGIGEFIKLESIKIASTTIPLIYDELMNRLLEFNESLNFDNLFGNFRFINKASDFTNEILQHHFKIQKNKPPFGKAPWIESLPGDQYIIRPLYRRNEFNSNENKYVHGYRINAIRSFLTDMHRING